MEDKDIIDVNVTKEEEIKECIENTGHNVE